MYSITPEQARRQLIASIPKLQQQAEKLRVKAAELDAEIALYQSWSTPQSKPLSEAQLAINAAKKLKQQGDKDLDTLKAARSLRTSITALKTMRNIAQ
ncbi:hypothetical protein [Vibrio sp. M260118]|uniref:hypothetical protein n=1 Tax=Vibrio sp. M260118 TaxID=3020896 RepID=UPI002F41F99B